MNVYKKIINKQGKIAVIGLGYVGLPLAVSFARKVEVVGFDIDKIKLRYLIQLSLQLDMLII